MAFYAHSGNSPEDKSDWQELPVHLKQVAELACKSGEKLGIGSLARLAGLLHDLGKYNSVFQKRLEGDTTRVDHSTAGAKILVEMAQTKQEEFCARMVAYTILGHHAGLPDYTGDEASFEKRLKNFKNPLDSQWKNEIAISFDRIGLDFFSRISQSQYPGVDLSFIIRMLFSCLVDADRRDTEIFCKANEGRELDRDWPSLQSLLPDFLARYNTHMAAFCNREGALNRLRNEILDAVRAKAQKPGDFYTLTVPTGGGKTLASLGFALEHAKAHGLERIIYAIPYTSIIDQTAAIFKSLLGEDNVFEHHSSFDLPDSAEDGGAGSNREKLKAAMEDWGAPVIVTTNVQLFESLYSARPSVARKLRNIANSVIVLDEAQTIPLHLLAPCMRALDSLVRLFNCTVVFCTATQPALDEAHMTGGQKIAALPLAGKELAPDPTKLAGELRRATICLAGEMDNNTLIEALTQTEQGLVIVNSRRHAFDLYKEGERAGLDGLVHLTTRQYAAHRRKILQSIRERLKAGEPCRVIATSLVEAGVDLDFPHVWRAEAGLDQVLQAAGRCNREGLRNADESIVTVFKAGEEYKRPFEIKKLAESLQKILPAHRDNLQNPEAVTAYFRQTYWQKDKEGLDTEKIVERLVAGANVLKFPFRSIGGDFRMIESTMVPVIIQRDEEAQKIVREIGVENISSGSIARRLQSYVVQVPPKFREKLIQNGHVRFHAPDLRGDQFAVLETASLYRDDVGLIWEDADYLGEGQMMI